MPTLYDIKPRFQALLRPLLRAIAQRGITPNQITLAALVLSVGTGLALTVFVDSPRMLLLLPPVLLLRMGLNALDGMLAREYRLTSSLGLFLNELGDVFSDAALYLPFALRPGFHPALIVGIVVLAITGEMAGVLGTQVGGTRRYDGPFGKSDRALAFGLLALLIGVGVQPAEWTTGLCWVLLSLQAWTNVNRVHRSLNEARR